jgi:hypothetical protein
VRSNRTETAFSEPVLSTRAHHDILEHVPTSVLISVGPCGRAMSAWKAAALEEAGEQLEEELHDAKEEIAMLTEGMAQLVSGSQGGGNGNGLGQSPRTQVTVSALAYAAREALVDNSNRLTAKMSARLDP